MATTGKDIIICCQKKVMKNPFDLSSYCLSDINTSGKTKQNQSFGYFYCNYLNVSVISISCFVFLFSSNINIKCLFKIL